MRALVFFLSAVLTAIPALAADKIVTGPDGVQYVVPAGSTVGAPTYGRGEDVTVTFAGSLVLTGTLHVEGDPTAPYVFLKPDRDVAARLPRYKESGAPTEIGFENSDAVLAAVMPAATRAAMKAGRLDTWNKHVSLDVDRFNINIECDVATYQVRFLKIHAPDTAVAQRVVTEEGC